MVSESSTQISMSAPPVSLQIVFFMFWSIRMRAHNSLKTHHDCDCVLFMGGVTELYLSSVSDSYVCRTHSLMHCVPTPE